MTQLTKDFNPGYQPRAADPRDVPFSAVFGGQSVQFGNGYDLSKKLVLKVEDQGQSLSCVAQAWSKYAEIKRKLTEGLPTDASARDIYARIYIRDSGGAYGYKGGSILKVGVGREQDIPSYINGKPPTEDFMRQLRDPAVTGAHWHDRRHSC